MIYIVIDHVDCWKKPKKAVNLKKGLNSLKLGVNFK